ncbi:SPFH domain-containing protein [Clostridiales bacterium]|nr:SPFH domain-containing protein [Clostridiales bacterium]
MKKKGLIIAGVVVLALVLVGTLCTATVQTGYTGIVTTFGKVENMTLEAGLHLKSPFQQIISMDNREQKTTFTTEAFSSDIQQVNITGSINYAINKSTAMNLFKEVGTDYFNKLVYPRMLEITKGVFSKYTAENLVANRQKLSESIRDGLSEELQSYGINVISLSIENIDFTDAFTDAVEAKQVAAQRKLQAEIEQAQMTMETQQQAERQRINAEAAANVAKINADADAYAMKVRSEAEAEANKMIAESLTENLIRANEIKSWDGKLPVYMAGEGGTTIPVLQFGQENGTEGTNE